MEQLPGCPLFTISRNGPVCLAGVNFLAVGEDRKLCHHCKLLAMGRVSELLSCKHLEVYTYLTQEDQHSVVRPIFECRLPSTAPVEKRCATCPAAVSSTQEQEIFV